MEADVLVEMKVKRWWKERERERYLVETVLKLGYAVDVHDESRADYRQLQVLREIVVRI